MPIQVSLSDEEEGDVGLRIEGSPTDAPKPDISQVIDNKGQEEEKQAGNEDQFEVPHEPPGTAQIIFLLPLLLIRRFFVGHS